MLCNELPGSVTISWGTFTTTNDFSNPTYSYYGGSNDTHFTVTDTNGGKAEFSRFHISTGSFNAHLWFQEGYPNPDNPWASDPQFGQGLPTGDKEKFETWAKENWSDINANAMEFWNKARGQ